MYAKIENGLAVQYPLSEAQIRASLPNMSIDPDFANNLPEGYVQVLPNSAPRETDTQKPVEILPEMVDGVWVQMWVMVDKYTPQEWEVELAKREAAKWERMRSERQDALNKTEWVVQRHKEQKELGIATSISDAEYMAWLTYRQELRDFPSTVTDINNYALPTAPGQLGVSNG